MAKFKLPPVSPLIGSNLINYLKIIFNNRISVKYYLNIFITFLIILLLTPFQFIDYLIFTFKLRNYTIKKDPIFIIGHWRSGTTFLHNLLCKDTNFSFFNTYNSLLINNLYTSFLFKILMYLVMPKESPGGGMKLDVDLPQEDEFAVSNFNDSAHYLFFYFPNDYKKYYIKSIRFENSESDRRKWIKIYDKLIKRILIYTNKDQILIKNPSNT
ncbi:MAG TPA: sulfotransferase, partial [Flavobacteriaceae bacterium]|nr:sulfotransferase [Flavobacteriaceae bacterium]